MYSCKWNESRGKEGVTFMLSSKSGNAAFDLQQVDYIVYRQSVEVMINVNGPNSDNGNVARLQRE